MWNGAVEGSGIKLYIGMADYKAAASLGDANSAWKGGQEILEQMRLNQTLDNVAGEIHFNFDSVLKLANNGILLYN